MNRRLSRILWGVPLYAVLLGGAAFCLLPFVWMIRSSLMSVGQIFRMPIEWIPRPFSFKNYTEALTVIPFGQYFLNTLFIVVFSVIGAVISASLSAFGFARARWPGRNIVFGILLTGMMLPSAVTLIPTFIGWRALGAINTYVPLIAPSWFGGGIFNVFLLRQFYMTVPLSLDEAARVDGAGMMRIFAQIIVPLTKPALIVVALFTFINVWNDFMQPMIYLNSDTKYTLALGLQSFKGMYNAQWHLMMAAATIVILPAVIIFLIGQDYLINGITMTGLKD